MLRKDKKISLVVLIVETLFVISLESARYHYVSLNPWRDAPSILPPSTKTTESASKVVETTKETLQIFFF